jgi:hypothetical protein
MTGWSFQASTSNGVVKGRGVEDGCNVGRTIEVGRGVREGTLAGGLNLDVMAFEKAGVGDGGGTRVCVGTTGVTSAAHAANKQHSAKFRNHFITEV